MRTLFPLVLIAVGIACAHNEADMTASEHRELAATYSARATSEEMKFDPNETREAPARTPFADGPEGWLMTYNPTEAHIAAADEQMRKAARENAAAARLEAFENQECGNVPQAQRSACPLLASQVLAVHDTRTGIALELKPTADGQDIYKRLACHLAWSKVNGFATPSCPLFTRGMSLMLKSPKLLELNGDSKESVLSLQTQAKQVFVGSAAQPLSVSAR